MVVIAIENAPAKLRGELTKWLMEVKAGIFVGTVSAIVREKLWEKVDKESKKKGAVLLYSQDNEQGFSMEMSGDPTRNVIDLDGAQLIHISKKESTVENNLNMDDPENIQNLSEIESKLNIDSPDSETENIDIAYMDDE